MSINRTPNCGCKVALTRARRHLVVVGQAEALQQSSRVFGDIISAARMCRGGFHGSGGALLETLEAVPSRSAVQGAPAAGLWKGGPVGMTAVDMGSLGGRNVLSKSTVTQP